MAEDAEDKEQLVDERTMEKMSVAPPDPETDADRATEDGAIDRDTAADHASGVADQDPLSAHPS